MPASIGVNLRVTGHCRQGGRKYMEDFFSVAYQQTEDEKDLEYAFFGIYDGHGGAEAAAYAKEHLMETIIRHKNFWSDYDEDVLRAIKDGYIATHYAMWKEQEKWPKTASGLPSTAGTTASVAFIRRGKIYIGHVGDSGIILGYQEPGSVEWKAKPLTRDHKPENADEMSRIEKCGGKVVSKSGVPRVVWNRPRIGHQGPVRRSTPIDEIPFLAVARSLGDLWSYNSQIDRFIVSPQPDCLVIPIDTDIHRCLIFGTDGLFNMLSPILAVHIVQHAERHNENAALSDSTYKTWLNPSKLLVEKALDRWHTTKMRADNTSAVTLMLDPPGPPRAQVLKDRKKNLPERGLKIMTRFDGNVQDSPSPNNNNNCDSAAETTSESEAVDPETAAAATVLESEESGPPVPPAVTEIEVYPSTIKEVDGERDCLQNGGELDNETPVSSSDLNTMSDSNQLPSTCQPLKERNHLLKKPLLRESTSFDPRLSAPDLSQTPDDGKENKRSVSPLPSMSSSSSSLTQDDPIIQCNEVSSSNIELEGNCEDTVDSKTEKRSESKESRILRSRGKVFGKGENNRKRKLPSDEKLSQPRKSLRLESSQCKSMVPTQKRLRKSAIPEEKRKLTSFAQKLLKCKTMSLKKKKAIVQQPVLTKKKIPLVVQKVNKDKKQEKPLKVKKKPDKATKKIVTTKVAFLRRSKATGSQRSKEKSQQRNRAEVKMKCNAKDVKVPKKHVAVKRSNSSSNVPNSQMSLRMGNVPVKEVPSSSSRKSSPGNKAATKRSEDVKTITLKKRLQQKTERLRKNVMHK